MGGGCGRAWLAPTSEGPSSRLIRRWSGLRPGLPPLLLLVAAAIVVLAVWFIIGETLTRVLGDDWVGRTDRSLSRWFARTRTGELNTVTQIVTYLSETITVTIVGSIVFVAARIVWKRWREPLFLLAAVTGEVVIFLGLTLLVDRNRPKVDHLDIAPPTSSFPSGHTAAAVVLYGALFIIASDRVRSATVVKLAAAGAVLIPIIVGVSRLYRGMHFPTDVLAGAALGVIWLLITVHCTRLGVGHAELGRHRESR